ncbi:MAG: hypothetical protein GY903_17055 [Fuerstiella sp.]|nr:hypothetical protein [Fuerstiella sp.]MCP4856192.1 hypothetical protein [Fuerstiella sp.]
MKRRSTDQQCTAPRRRGTLTVWTLLVMVSCICCVSLVANTGYLSSLRSDSHHCAQAAALAAGRRLLTDDILRRSRQDFEVDAWHLNAQNAAIEMGQVYAADCGVPQLTPGHITIEMGAIAVAHIGRAPDSGTFPPRVHVNVANHDANESSGNFVLGSLIGITHGIISERSQAILENQIVGFRPGPQSATPIVPLALPDDPTCNTTHCWSTEIETDRGQDRFTWDDSTDAVRSGPDRLSELVLTIKSGDTPGGPGIAQLVSWNTQTSVKDALAQFAAGLGQQHLSADGDGVLVFPSAAGQVPIDSGDVRELAEVIRPLIGSARIFPLYDASESALKSTAESDVAGRSLHTTAANHQILRVVAARIIRLEDISDQQIRIVLQPTVLSTPTAVVSAANETTPHNRYVWKIRLAE